MKRILIALLLLAGIAGGVCMALRNNSGQAVADTITAGLGGLINCPDGEATFAKPVIYLYPKQKTDVQVKLNVTGTLTCTYPAYRDGWTVTAQPDGTLVDMHDGKEYSYLFWEAKQNTAYDLSEGFVVKGSDTAKFLQKTLSEMGLTPREYNEFIVYWLPKMQEHPYNYITFQQKAYTDAARLEITPKPDSVLRIFMAYQPLEQPPKDVTELFAESRRTDQILFIFLVLRIKKYRKCIGCQALKNRSFPKASVSN